MGDDAADSSADVGFFETVEHLGGVRTLLGGVLLLLVAYIVLVEWLLPRRREQDTVMRAKKRR